MIVFLITSVKAQNLSNQYNVVGTIRDSATKKPIAYATISIFDTLQNDMGSTYSLENGLFKIILSEPGSYRLEISIVGYRNSEFNIDMTKDALTVKLGDIFVVPDHVSLQEVRVTGRKRLVEQKPGMLVYNAESDITNKGGTAADVLRKAPILNVDAQGNVSMRGSSNLKILINGKYSGQMARSAADALNMMPAGMIQSVEIITNPSAKYDAEGAAGVINIITKKGKKDISGTLEASASNLEQMFNPRLSLAKEKWNVNIAGHLHRLRRKSEELQERTSFSGDTATSDLRQAIAKDNTAPHGSADIAVDYKINEMSELSLGMNTWFGNWPEDSRMNSAVRTGSIITENYLQNIASSNSYLGADINIGYNRRFKRPGRQITLLAQGSPSRTISKYDVVKNATNQVLLYRELNYSTTKNKEWTFQADYVQPINVKGTVHLESGIKIILRNVGNQYNVSASEPNQPDKMIPQDDRSDNFRYSQDVMAGYSMFKINLKNNWYAEAGARLESTYIKGNFVRLGTGFDNQFLNFIPSATLSRKLDERRTFNVSYTKRLTRPYILDLNPNVNTSDPKNIKSGNPELKPEIVHQAEFSYNFNTGQDFFMNTSVFWKQTNNTIIEFMETNAQGISFTSKQNLAANKQFGLNFSATSNLSERLAVNGNANIHYYNYSSKAFNISSAGWGADVNVNGTYKLPHSISVQAFAKYNTRMITLLGTLDGIYQYSFAGKKEIKKARISVTIAAVNIFTNYISQVNTKQRFNYISIVDQQFYNRSLKLTVNWEFGGVWRQKERKKIDNNDVNVQGKG